MPFSVLQVETKANKFQFHKKPFISKIMKLCEHANYADFRSRRAKFSWLTNARPNIRCHVAKLVQVVEETSENDKHRYIKGVNKIMEHLKNKSDIFIIYPHLDKDSLPITSYSDVSFGSNDDHKSQIRYFIFLSEKYNNCPSIYWTFYKVKQVTISVFRSDVIALANDFDRAYFVKYDLQNKVNHKNITYNVYR